MLEDLGLACASPAPSMETWRVEMLAGDTRAAERELGAAYELLGAMGEKYLLSTIGGSARTDALRARALRRGGGARPTPEELATEDDVDDAGAVASTSAKILGTPGAPDEAEALVRDALEILARRTQSFSSTGAIFGPRRGARDCRTAGGSRDALQEALQLAELEGSPVMADCRRGACRDGDSARVLARFPLCEVVAALGRAFDDDEDDLVRVVGDDVDETHIGRQRLGIVTVEQDLAVVPNNVDLLAAGKRVGVDREPEGRLVREHPGQVVLIEVTRRRRTHPGWAG